MKGFDKLLAAAALLVVLVNGLILAGVAWNRRAPPESVLTLSERELWMTPASLSPGTEESNGLTLRLQWAVLPAHWDSSIDLSTATGGWVAPVWLDQPEARRARVRRVVEAGPATMTGCCRGTCCSCWSSTDPPMPRR